ncbi:TonB-dependent receptor [Novosphingobium sp. EMRT-2]|uniref:TonB-dependent receptor n=1 Tax=Novosphingobium sp. EMRT-2 TaxID=2571749 RepID=UPI0010BD92A8|nr:TonB-dependent receptor [Novosphingobium sp. EMRT-2]QCI95846.1 TonB-dependent receptor [Novosphingobium sp. EMRT-2]
MTALSNGPRLAGLLVSLSASVALPGIAMAQMTAPATESASSTDPLAGDIVVTARKREESAQSVPLAISAFSGAAIEARGVQKIDGLASFTPNMTLQNNPSFGGAGSSAAIYIRGIGQKEFLPTTEPGVGVYVDGVYVARSVGALLDLVDVERVEILRGPQGTLFGRNTIGGAISITTKKPDETPSGNLQVTTGRFSRIDVKASANIPLSDTLFSKVTVATFNRDGYVRHLVDGRELGDVGTLTGRFDLRWKPSSTFEVNLAVEGTRDRTNGPAFVLSGVTYKSAIFNPQNLPMLPPGSPATAGAYVLNPPFDAPTDNFTLLHNYFATLLGGQPCFAFAPYSPQGNAAACFSNRFIVGDGADAGTGPQYARNDLWGAQAVIDWDLGPVQLKSITAYRHVSGDYARDGDHSPFTILHLADILKQHQFSQELQVLGNTADDKLKYVVGLYYFNENGNNINNLDFTPVTFRSGGKFATKSYAAFGQATWTPIPLIDLTFGLRYTKDKKSFLPDQEILVDKTGGALIAASPNTPQTRVLPYVTAYRNEDAVTPSANIAFHVADNVLAYASFSKGFKSGGFVQRVFPPQANIPQFGAEKATAYEIGFKSKLFNRRLTLNGALFLTKYDELQVQVFTGIAPVTKNAASAEIKGLELEGRLDAGAGWFLEGSLGYLHPRFTAIDPAAAEITLASKFERVSNWSLSGAVSKSVELANGGNVRARIDWSYRSGAYMDALNSPELYQPSYSLFNANVTYTFPGEKVSVFAGVTNLTDKQYLQTGVYGASFGLYEKLYARPREWSAGLKWSF